MLVRWVTFFFLHCIKYYPVSAPISNFPHFRRVNQQTDWRSDRQENEWTDGCAKMKIWDQKVLFRMTKMNLFSFFKDLEMMLTVQVPSFIWPISIPFFFSRLVRKYLTGISATYASYFHIFHYFCQPGNVTYTRVTFPSLGDLYIGYFSRPDDLNVR